MKYLAFIFWGLSLLDLPAAEATDLLRFSNGDQLHGSFLGIKEGPQAVWQRQDLATPVDFKITRIRHVVLHGGRPLKPMESISHIGLINGDRMPGTLTGIDENTLTLDTPYAGVLSIPRNQVALLAPNPLGGRLYYHGPFIENEWTMAHASFPDGLPPEGVAADTPKAPEAPGENTSTREGADSIARPERWIFSGSAWYWKNKSSGTALIRESGMPDRAILRFDLAWKNRLCLAIGFHADFARPKPKEEENKGKPIRVAAVRADMANLPILFGNSYVLQLYANYFMLFRSSINADGKPAVEQIQVNSTNNIRLPETGEATVELRSNRLTGVIALFIDEEFVTQWNENNGTDLVAPNFAGKGPGFGFLVQSSDSCARISDVIVSEWNGMPDSARSLQVDDQDVVLMTNGTDRYAGRVGSFDKQGGVRFEGKHGKFQFPLEEIAEIRFARHRLASAPEAPEDRLVVRFHPLGTVSGRPLAGDSSTLDLLNSSAGKLHLTLDAAVMLDFDSSKHIIDDWDASF